MEQNKPISHITAGLLISAIIVLFAIITNFFGLANQGGIGLLQYVLIIAGLIFFVNRYGKAHDYTRKFGDLFAFGFKATAVYTLVFIVFIVIFFLLFPDLKEKTFEIARQQMEEQGNASEEQIDQAIDIARRFFWVGVVGGSAFMLVIIGAIGSLLGAALTKKRPHNPFEQANF